MAQKELDAEIAVACEELVSNGETRKNQQSIVSIYCMTYEELKAKAEELRIMGQRCFEYADEIDRLTDQRQLTAS